LNSLTPIPVWFDPNFIWVFSSLRRFSWSTSYLDWWNGDSPLLTNSSC
jgi:hypothetical protein